MHNIKTWLGQFDDPNIERQFQNFDLDETRRGLRNAFLFAIFAIALGALLDITSFKDELAMHRPTLLTLRAFVIAWCLAHLAFVRTAQSYRRLCLTLPMWALVSGTAFMYIAKLYMVQLGRSDSLYWYCIGGCLTAALFPVPIRYAVLAAIGFVSPGIVLHTILTNPDGASIARVLIATFVSLLLGYTIGLRLNRGRRFNFARIETEHKLNSLLKDEVIKRSEGEAAAKQHASFLQEQLNHSQKMEAIGRLAGGLAHDINNVLTPIMGYTDLMRLDISADDKNYDAVVQVNESAVRAKELINKLLAFSRKQVMDMQTICLCETLSTLHSILRRLIREDIDMIIERVDEPCTIIGDVTHIEQVILNLVINASDAMPGGGTLTLGIGPKYISEDAANGMDIPFFGPAVRLQVTDTGTGIKKEHLGQIFEPFFTTKDSDKGTGLGLATVYGIVRQHDGAVFVNSEPSKGTTFTVYFPLRKMGAPAEAGQTVDVEKLPETGTILLVEDEETVRKLTRQMLEHTGYTVYAASNADEARVLFDAFKDNIDLLLTDVVMPGKNGKELSETLRLENPKLKVLYVSGYADDVLKARGILDGSTPCLRKPFTLPHLRKQVRRAIFSSS